MSKQPTVDELRQKIKKLENEILERNRLEEELERIFNFSPDLIGSGNLEGYFTKINSSFKQILGYTEKAFLEKPFISFVHDEDVEKTKEALADAVKGKRDIYIENRYKCRDGSYKWIEWKVLAIAKENKFIAAGREISERKEAENERLELQKRLNRSKKMEALGLLAGGVAHDLNNILSGIVGYPDLLLMDENIDQKVIKSLEIIKQSGQRAAAVVEDLLTVSRGIVSSKKTLNLNPIIQEYISSPEYSDLAARNSNVTMKISLDPDLLNITGSLVHIKNAFANLVINAFESIHNDIGTVTISTRNQYVDKPIKGYDEIHIGEYAVLTVADSGVGISAKDIDRIFEPFYTKKEMGRRSGTGLGLTIVWNTIQNHDGYLEVKNSQHGTTFELYYPITRDKIDEEKEQVPFEDYAGNGEKILVVDDMGSQRKIACSMLEKLGYIAESVSSGEEALDYIKAHSVDLLLIDMIMAPGINGRETYERIVKIFPGQKAIIASGYSETDEVRKAMEMGVGNYIKKPYTLEKIGVAIRDELMK